MQQKMPFQQRHFADRGVTNWTLTELNTEIIDLIFGLKIFR